MQIWGQGFPCHLLDLLSVWVFALKIDQTIYVYDTLSKQNTSQSPTEWKKENRNVGDRLNSQKTVAQCEKALEE